MKHLIWLSMAVICACSGMAVGQTDPNSRALHHFYEVRKPFFHFYTADSDETAALKKHAWWNYVGIKGYVLAKARSGTVPLYRLVKSEFGGTNHFYTVDMNEANSAINSGGWTAEGVVGYVMPKQVAGTEPLYRLYLECQVPNDGKFRAPCQDAIGGDVHYYTANGSEKNTAIHNGMRFIRVEAYIWSQPVSIVPPPVPKIQAGKIAIDPATDLLNRGCTRTAVGSYKCDSVGAYEACNSYRKVGKVKSCSTSANLTHQKSMDTRLFSLGCTRFLGRPDEYICKTQRSFDTCEAYRKMGTAKKCVMAKQ